MHPDLRRQLTERHRHRADARLAEIDRYRRLAEEQTDATDGRLQRKRERTAALEAELAALRPEVASLEECSAALRQLTAGVSNQAYYQRCITEEQTRRPLRSTARSPPPAGLGATARLVDMRAAVGAPAGCDPSAAGRREGDGTAGGRRPLSPLDVHSMHDFDFCNAAPARAEAADHEQINRFLKRFAPLFMWSPEQRCVPPPLLFDEPCLMEQADERQPCGNPACAYWHRSQLHHLKAAFQHLVTAAVAAHSADHRLCGVSKLFATLAVFIDGSPAIDQLCCGVGYALNRVVALGWHEVLMAAAAGGGGGEGGGWPVPVAAAAAEAAGGDPLAAVPLGSIASEEERDAWEVAVTALAHGSTAADVFTAAPSALSWRCLSRLAAGASSAGRRWLANQGRLMFPASPHAQLAHVLGLLEPGGGATAGERLAACLEAARVLSSQAAAASLAQPDTVYSAVAARYTGCMVAVCTVALVAVTPELAERLLTTVLTPGGGYLLLPVAQQNLTLMLVALQQTGRLSGAELLPLAAVGDCALTLSTEYPAAPRDACVERLNGQLALLNGCQRDGMDPALVDRLKAAVQLALVRTFSLAPQYVEQIVRKAAPHGEETQAALWLAYARSLCFVDGFPSCLKVTADLLESGAGHCSCLLALLLSWQLQSHGVHHGPAAAAATAAAAFLARHGLTAAAACGGGAAIPPGVAPVEWAACQILLALALPFPAARLDLLARIPMTGLLPRADGAEAAVVLLLSARVRAAAAMGSVKAFRHGLESCIGLMAAAHRQWWSPLDAWADGLVGAPHWAALCVYRSVPFILGSQSGALTLQWRTVVLEVASRHRVLHPILRDGSQI